LIFSGFCSGHKPLWGVRSVFLQPQIDENPNKQLTKAGKSSAGLFARPTLYATEIWANSF
jgi:hypothetical protein